jgi:hypothetical protein
MRERTEIAEGRVHKRVPAKERALVYIGSESDCMLYHLIDISNGGLSFRYLGEDVSTQGLSELSLVLKDTCYAAALPVETVSDTPLINNNVTIRRRSVRFGELSAMQKSQLYDFIKKNAE